MIDLLQITNDPEVARRCDALDGMRLFVDLESLGKAERQAGRSTFISAHKLEDVRRVKSVLRRTRLMVRVNPLNPNSQTEVDDVLAMGADWLMLPMFRSAAELQCFVAMVAGRAPVVPLLETSEALQTLEEWIDTPGLIEVFVGLNDLHLSLGQRFMFEPLVCGLIEKVAHAAHMRGLRFGFGGIARHDEGLLPGRDVLAEHLRLGSQAVILSRTFHRDAPMTSLEQGVAALRAEECVLVQRSSQEMEFDRLRVNEAIATISKTLRRCA